MSRPQWPVLLAALAFATGAAAEDPFGGVSDLCRIQQLKGYSCWYSTATKKCVCDLKPGEGGGAGGGTTPTRGGVNTKPTRPDLLFEQTENGSITFSPSAFSSKAFSPRTPLKDVLVKDVLAKDILTTKARGQ